MPYATPTAGDNETGYKFGVLDFGGISSSTEYPREAYELLKFMGWGAEGWEYKLEAYKTLEAEDGTPIYMQSMPLPITLDDDIWDDLVQEFYPTLTKDESEQDEKDQKYGQYFDDYFEQVKRGVIPFGDCQIPGFSAFVNAETGPYAGVEDSVINGEKTASDWVEEMTNQANEYNRQAMESIDY